MQKKKEGKSVKILLVEDNPDDVGLVLRELQQSELLFELLTVKTKEDYVRMIGEYAPDIILSDHTLPSFDSREAFSILKERSVIIPFILVTGSVSEEFAVECIKAGMSDYILKTSLKRLPSSIENILAGNKIKREKSIIEALHIELKKAYKKIAEKNKDITDSIIYAKSIQNALLPDPEKLNAVFAESFIYYNPRDIVSGDFYWFKQYDNKFIIAVADCTGHGVPGALMSVIGIELLNKVVNEQHIMYPSDILRSLNVGITRVFNQHQNETYDGMDIAVCCFDLLKNTLEYAGANRPILIMRDKFLQEIAPSKYSVGAGTETKVFVTHKVDFKKNDRVYLFTDGLIDQFGGFYDKKLMKSKLKKLLVSSQELSIKQQMNAMSDFINSWKGANEQVDDMLAIGIKY